MVGSPFQRMLQGESISLLFCFSQFSATNGDFFAGGSFSEIDQFWALFGSRWENFMKFLL